MLNNEEIVDEFLGETQKNKICLPFSENIRVWQKRGFLMSVQTFDIST